MKQTNQAFSVLGGRKEAHMSEAASKMDLIVAKCRELELTCRLWIAANDVKEARIRELEAECNQLRRRVARLSRRVGRRQKVAIPDQVRFAR